MLRAIAVTVSLTIGASLALPAFAQQNCDAPGAMCGGNKNKRSAGGGTKGSPTPSTGTAPTAQQYLIGDKDRAAIKQHFVAFMAKGNCPPDMQKSASGCVASVTKSWAIGQVLPNSVIAHPLPDPLQSQLTPAPNGYRYGRIGSDVLLVATNGNMVMDDFDFLAK